MLKHLLKWDKGSLLTKEREQLADVLEVESTTIIRLKVQVSVQAEQPLY